MNAIINYIRDIRAELTHVSWPTTRQAVVFTILVLFISVLTSLYLGAFDFIFTWVLENIVL